MQDRLVTVVGRLATAVTFSALLSACGGDDGGSSSSGGTVTLTVPGAPTIGTATAGDTTASVAFTAPSSNGGATITSYTATCTAAGSSITATNTASAITVTGLTNGTSYSCSVTATNSVGTSAASGTASVTPAAGVATALPAAFNQFGANVTVVYDASAGTVTLEAAGRPDHTSPYWDENGTSGLYVAAGPETTVTRMSPGRIDEYTNQYFLTVPVNPQKASATTATGLGSIGIAITGSPIFNDQEGPNDNLNSGVISGFDNYGAHTGPQVYHYHMEPTPISNDDTNLFAILRDGFFIYGRKCDSTGDHPTDLDASGGHTSTTQYSTDPVYHYHIKDQIYLNVNGKDNYVLFDGAYQGTPNDVTN